MLLFSLGHSRNGTAEITFFHYLLFPFFYLYLHSSLFPFFIITASAKNLLLLFFFTCHQLVHF
jgi:hypothetical protein